MVHIERIPADRDPIGDRGLAAVFDALLVLAAFSCESLRRVAMRHRITRQRVAALRGFGVEIPFDFAWVVSSRATGTVHNDGNIHRVS